MHTVPRPQTAGRPFKSGFTLIELLVVIAIISLLAAILFPVFGRARENARRSSCLSNMKQIGLGLMQYTQDFDERLPPNDDITGRWTKKINIYVKSAQVFVCPSASTFTVALDGNNLGMGSSYAINTNLSGYDIYALEGISQPARSLVEMANSAGTAVFMETSQLTAAVISSPDNNNPTKWPLYIDTTNAFKGNSNYQWQTPGCWSKPYPACHGGAVSYLNTDVNSLRRPIARHFDGFNVTYADGHAKWTRADKFLGPMPNGWAYGDPNNSWDNL